MIKTHFEVAKKIYNDTDYETQSIFSDDLLSVCLVYFKENKLNPYDYFIDVWETKDNGTPYPIGEIKL